MDKNFERIFCTWKGVREKERECACSYISLHRVGRKRKKQREFMRVRVCVCVVQKGRRRERESGGACSEVREKVRKETCYLRKMVEKERERVYE